MEQIAGKINILKCKNCSSKSILTIPTNPEMAEKFVLYWSQVKPKKHL